VSGKKAVVLLSGGLDSTTLLAIARQQGFVPHALTCSYGQRHGMEIDVARQIARQMEVAQHVVVEFDLRVFGGSALTADLAVPKHASAEEIGQEIPITYVPARNTIFLSFALAWAEVLTARDIFIGVNALDYSGYPDCRPEFIQAFQQMAQRATKAGVEGHGVTIHTPLLDLTKAQIIAWGLELGVDYGQTTSCYDPTPAGLACGYCDACLLRKRGFEELKVPDPTRYAAASGRPAGR
jgi:7-cyano-7-deazaguanine synthase